MHTSEKFDLGRVIITPTASAALQADGKTPADLLSRHQSGDWGDVTEQERSLNERGLAGHFNLQSVYKTIRGDRVAVVTKADRSLTLVHIDPRTI